MRNLRAFLFLPVLLFALNASANYEFDQKLRHAYAQIIRLRLEEGHALLEEEKNEKPDNNLVLLFDNYIDFLKAFISEEDQAFVKAAENSSQRLNRIQKDRSNADSPWYLYAGAEITLQDAIIHIKSGDYFIAALEVRKSYKLINKNSILFPTFFLNKKIIGFLHAMIGSVPRKYRWLVEFAGLEGTVPQGKAELQKLFDLVKDSELSCFREEILFYLANIQIVIPGTETENAGLMERMARVIPGNPLVSYGYASLAMREGKNKEAYDVLTNLYDSVNTYPFYFTSYKSAIVRLQRLDFSAEADLHFFIRHFKGKNYIKSSYQKLAWICLIKGNVDGYKIYLDSCLHAGQQVVDEDMDAEEEAASGEIPNRSLLRSRLLFDGGFYQQSLEELIRQPVDSFPRFRDRLELTYRFGRIMQKQNLRYKAKEYFGEVLKNGYSSRYYFAANSALQLAMMFEEERDIENARKNYRLILGMNHHDYQNSIDQKAQAGLDRLKKM